MVSVPARNGAISITDQGRASDRGEHARNTETKMHEDVLIMRFLGIARNEGPFRGRVSNTDRPDHVRSFGEETLPPKRNLRFRKCDVQKPGRRSSTRLSGGTRQPSKTGCTHRPV